MTNTTTQGASSLIANGEKFVMRLTLGALSEIESGLGVKSLSDLGAKLKSFSASDLAVLAAALLRGGGHDITPADVMRLPTDIGSIIGAVSDALSAIGLAKNECESPFGWRRRLEFGLGVLRMRPADFWAMSVTEWNAAVAGHHAAHGITAPLARADLEQMMRLHPNTKHE